jgi:large subunit ribosomal protein L21
MKKSDIAFAVVRVGGKQYKVAPGDEIVVDRVAAAEGKQLTLEPLAVLDAGGKLQTGEAVHARVKAKVTDHFLGEKIDVFTYRPKTTFRKTRGHRSRLSRLAIESIDLLASKEKKSGS